MCEKCDAIKAQLAQQGINPEEGLADLAKKMLSQLAHMKITVMTCKVMNPDLGMPEDMQLVKKEDARELAKRLDVVAHKCIELMDQQEAANQTMELMHSNLVALSKIIESTGNEQAIAQLRTAQAGYEADMGKIMDEAGIEIADNKQTARNELAAEAAELLADPMVPEAVKDAVRAMEKALNETVGAATHHAGNSTKH